jgi:hypothetical protein
MGNKRKTQLLECLIFTGFKMTQLPKYIKLFHNAGIDYITSFIKLWLSFNAWYKKEFEHLKVTITEKNGSLQEMPIKQDWQAIKKCKQYEKIKGIFNSLLKTADYDEKKKFLESITVLLRLQMTYNKTSSENKFYYYYQSEIRFSDFIPKIDFKSYYEIYETKFNNKTIKLYVENGQEQKLLEAILDIIYELRCELFHGDFDIENPQFEKMIFHSHNILHLLLEKLIFD